MRVPKQSRNVERDMTTAAQASHSGGVRASGTVCTLMPETCGLGISV